MFFFEFKKSKNLKLCHNSVSSRNGNEMQISKSDFDKI